MGHGYLKRHSGVEFLEKSSPTPIFRARTILVNASGLLRYFRVFAATPSGRRIWVIWRYDWEDDENPDVFGG
jgi:hypothetical protein